MGPTISFYTRTHKWCSRFCLFLWLFHSRQRNTYGLNIEENNTCFSWLFEGMMSYIWKSTLNLFSIRCDLCFLLLPRSLFAAARTWRHAEKLPGTPCSAISDLVPCHFATCPWTCLERQPLQPATHIPLFSSCNKFSELSYLEKGPGALSYRGLLAAWRHWRPEPRPLYYGTWYFFNSGN